MTRIYDLGPFQLDVANRTLTMSGAPVALGLHAVAVLINLVERAPQLAPKASIIDAVWPDVIVEESNLPVQIHALRHALAGVPGGDRWIETLPRRGYRFVGPVAALPDPDERDSNRSNLPEPVTSFVGRERELVEIKRLLPAARLITIVGAGGIGKTRLALRVAAEVIDAYRHGAWLAELGSIRDSSLVPTSVAQALRVQERRTAPLIDSLRRYFAAHEMLLVLDNCEHLLDACAQFAAAVLGQMRHATIIATSREPLGVGGEQVYALQPLSIPDRGSKLDAAQDSEAVQLFVERVRRQLPGFELTPPRVPVVTELCIRLDGIPLALELAAARTRSLSVEQISARLRDRFRLLTGGSSSALPRQQTLRAALDWSYDLLSEDERAVLRRLSVFPGSFTVKLASAIVSDAAIDEFAVIDLLSRLMARSLVIADAGESGTRHRMFDTIRAYAAEELDETGETDALRRRHAQGFRDLFERESEDWLRMPDPEWRATYLSELANVRAALAWTLGPSGENAIAIDLAGASGPMWKTLGLFDEGVQQLEAAITRIEPDTAEPAQARLWFWLGWILDETPTRARPAFERAIELYRTLGDLVHLGLALVRLARVVARMGKFDESEAMLTEAWPFLKHAGPRALHYYHFNFGFLKNVTGDPVAARMHYEKALELARVVKDELSVMATMGNLANVKWGLGDLDGAAESTRELVALVRSSPASTRRLLGTGLMNLAGLLLEKKEPGASLAFAREALPLVRTEGSAWIYSDYGSERACSEGKFAKAALLAGYADHAHASNGGTRHAVAVRGRARQHSLLRERLLEAEFERLLAEGAKLSEDEAWRLALDD